MTDRIDPMIYPAITLTPPTSGTANAAPAGSAQAGSALAGAYGPVSAEDKASFLEAMARAWGTQLDKQTESMKRLSENLNSDDGENMHLTIALLTAESENLKALSTSASTATNSIAEALQTLSRKQ